MSAALPDILVVEDNKADLFLIREALDSAELGVQIHVLHDGEGAVEYITALDGNDRASCPSLVVVDINLPEKSGLEVLRHIRASRRCANIRVLAVTSSDSPRDRDLMSAHGVDGYFRKPSEYEGFMKLGEVIRSLLSRDQDSAS